MSSGKENEPLIRSITSSVNSSSVRNSNASTSHSNTTLDFSSSRIFLLPASRKHLLPGIIILFLVLLERVAFYSLTGNLFLFLNQNEFGWTPYNAMSALLLFTGISYLSSLLGGWLSDTILGRYKVIVLSFILFTVAYWFLPFISEFCEVSNGFTNCTNATGPSTDTPMYSENCSEVIIIVLVVAAIGTGTVKANITPFGAEQVRYSGPNGLRMYLNWLYWCVNIGAFIAILGIAYVQQSISFHLGYIIPAALLSFASILFIITFPLYVCQSPTGSAITQSLAIIKEAWTSNKRIRREQRREENAESSVVNSPSWLDMAKVTYGGKFHESAVENVKALPTIMIVFIALIPYWLLYFQMQTTFLVQGLHMRLNPFYQPNDTICDSSENVFYVPAAWLMLFNVLFLIFFIPLMNHVIYPCLDRRGIQISMLSRMQFGMICAATSMVMAGGLETYRMNLVHHNETLCQVIENTTYHAADVSVLWQIPQYSFIGISEVFTSVTGMEFACSQAPSSMQGAIMGLYYFCTGIGSFLGIVTLKAFGEIDKFSIHNHNFNKVNGWHMSYYFFFLAALQFVALLIFCLISRHLKVRKMPSPSGSRASIVGRQRTRTI